MMIATDDNPVKKINLDAWGVCLLEDGMIFYLLFFFTEPQSHFDC